MRIGIFAVAVSVLTLGSLLPGCGGGDDSISKEEFLREGNAICADVAESIFEEGRETFSEAEVKNTNAAGVPFVLGTFIPEFRKEVARLRALGIPDGDEAQVNSILRAIEEVIEKAKRDPEGMVHGVVNRYAKPQALARKYGLTECPTTTYTLW